MTRRGNLHFLIIGAGAMGCLFASRLKRSGLEVALGEKAHEVVEVINSQGLFVGGVGGQHHVMVPAYSDRPPHQPDLVLLCVKSHDTREAAQALLSWLQSEARILTLQNGVGNMEILQALFGTERVLGGITAEGATVIAPGRIMHAGEGETVIGGGKAAGEIVSAFQKAGFKARAVDDIRPFYSFDISCRGTVTEAMVAFLDSNSYEDAVRNAISLGGDSDTLACITGGVAEAFYGTVPKTIRDKVEELLPADLWEVTTAFCDKYR